MRGGRGEETKERKSVSKWNDKEWEKISDEDEWKGLWSEEGEEGWMEVSKA